MRELLPTYSRVSGLGYHLPWSAVLCSFSSFNHFYITINSINNQFYNNFNHHHPPLSSSALSSTPQSSCLCSLCSYDFFRIAFPHIASYRPTCPLYKVRYRFTIPSCSSFKATFPLYLKSNPELSPCCWGCWSVLHHHILLQHHHWLIYFDSVQFHPSIFFITCFQSLWFRLKFSWRTYIIIKNTQFLLLFRPFAPLTR